MMNLGHDVSRKRFNTHNNSKLSGFVRGKRFIAHDTVKLIMTPYTKTRKENHSPTLSFMRFQPRTGRMKERRQAESQKMAAGVKS